MSDARTLILFTNMWKCIGIIWYTETTCNIFGMLSAYGEFFIDDFLFRMDVAIIGLALKGQFDRLKCCFNQAYWSLLPLTSSLFCKFVCIFCCCFKCSLMSVKIIQHCLSSPVLSGKRCKSHKQKMRRER